MLKVDGSLDRCTYELVSLSVATQVYAHPDEMHIVIQEEVAERLTAQPNSNPYGYLLSG
jgi:16S rRNA A1518/A1519 N6-dimethyltransferase RsmA/KsgA/DIM1 with predicted DNA glycosylase/AP lyase activity